MVNAEEAVCMQQLDMDKLLHEIDRKDAEIEELAINIEDLETKTADLEALVELLQERHEKTEELLEETKKLHEKVLHEEKMTLKSVTSELETVRTDLSQVRSEKIDLIDMNENMSNQISEQLHMIKKLQDHEQDLVGKLENAKRDLELAHNGMTTELHAHWEAEDEVLNLQTELEETEIKLRDAKAEIARLNCKIASEQTQKSDDDKRLQEISANLVNAQADLELKEHDIRLLKHDIKSKKDTIENLKQDLKLSKDLSAKLNLSEEQNKKLKNALDSKTEQVSSLNLSLEAQQKLIAEKEAEVFRLKSSLAQAEKLADNIDSMQSKLIDQDEELKRANESSEVLKHQLEEKEKIIGILRQELDPLQENAQSYKEKYEAICTMIAPFREQLESFEMERNALLAQKQEAQGQLQKLASDYTNLLGHQNHKQKIHHLVRLKQENLDMREELAKVNLELNKQKRLVQRYKDASKENSSNPSLSILSTPMGGGNMAKTPFRRQTIASPLANRSNRK